MNISNYVSKGKFVYINGVSNPLSAVDDNPTLQYLMPEVRDVLSRYIVQYCNPENDELPLIPLYKCIEHVVNSLPAGPVCLLIDNVSMLANTCPPMHTLDFIDYCNQLMNKRKVCSICCIDSRNRVWYS